MAIHPDLRTDAADRSPDGSRDFYSISQAAELLGVSRVTIWRWIGDGRLPAARLGHRTTRIRRMDLDRLIEARAWAVRDPKPPAANGNGRARAPRPERSGSPPAGHFAQFYESDAYLLGALADFVGGGLRAGEAAILVATPPHRAGLDERLAAEGFDLAVARADGRYLALDAAELLAEFMVGVTPDPERFGRIVGDLVTGASTGGRPVRVFGEMVALLGENGQYTAAIALEALWNDLRERLAFTLFCAYPLDRLDREAFGTLLDGVWAEHGHVMLAESYTLVAPDDRLRAIAVLQRKARALEAEVAERQLAVRQRDEFLSITSHELRTPLTTIGAHAQLMLRRLARDGAMEQAAAERAFRTIAEQSDKLARLLDQLFDLSRLGTGTLTIAPGPTDQHE